MSDTPETNALIATDQHHLEDDNFFPATVYWRMCDLSRRLERERDERKEKYDRLAEALNEFWYNHSLTGSTYELIEQAIQFINKPTQ